MATTTELKEEVLNYQFSSRYAPRIIKWFNEAQAIIISETQWAGALTRVNGELTIGTPHFTIDEAYDSQHGGIYQEIIDSIINVYVHESGGTSYTPLTQVDNDEYWGTYENTVRGKPTIYCKNTYGAYLLLFPIPDAEYTIHIDSYSNMTTQSHSMLDGSEPVIPLKWQPMLVDYALFRAYASEHDLQHSQYHKGLFDTALLKARHQANNDLDADRIPVVEGTWTGAHTGVTMHIPS